MLAFEFTGVWHRFGWHFIVTLLHGAQFPIAFQCALNFQNDVWRVWSVSGLLAFSELRSWSRHNRVLEIRIFYVEGPGQHEQGCTKVTPNPLPNPATLSFVGRHVCVIQVPVLVRIQRWVSSWTAIDTDREARSLFGMRHISLQGLFHSLRSGLVFELHSRIEKIALLEKRIFAVIAASEKFYCLWKSSRVKQCILAWQKEPCLLSHCTPPHWLRAAAKAEQQLRVRTKTWRDSRTWAWTPHQLVMCEVESCRRKHRKHNRQHQEHKTDQFRPLDSFVILWRVKRIWRTSCLMRGQTFWFNCYCMVSQFCFVCHSRHCFVSTANQVVQTDSQMCQFCVQNGNTHADCKILLTCKQIKRWKNTWKYVKDNHFRMCAQMHELLVSFASYISCILKENGRFALTDTPAHANQLVSQHTLSYTLMLCSIWLLVVILQSLQATNTRTCNYDQTNINLNFHTFLSRCI